MKFLKITLLMGITLAVGAISVQASPIAEGVHTYERQANDAYSSFENTVSKQESRLQEGFEQSSDKSLQDIGTGIKKAYYVNSDQASRRVLAYKKVIITQLEAGKRQLTAHMYDDYEKKRKKRIHEEMTEDITDFLENITE